MDFSFESLRDIDELLNRYLPHYTYASHLVALGDAPEMGGSYIGEVLRRKWGGEWVQVTPDGYPELLVRGRRVSPSSAVAQWFESSGASVSKFVEDIAVV